MTFRRPALAWLLLAALGWALGCGRGRDGEGPVAPGGSRNSSAWPADDRSMCNWKGKPELEVTETPGLGSIRANVRRVYQTFGDGESRQRTLICREMDSNLDGIKDLVRTFNAKGEAVHEEADRDYDGKMDAWLDFVDGRLAEEDLDTNRDGKPDVWKFYMDGHLQRVKRDRNFDGNPDVWEIYTRGRLERIGYDESRDGHVDRWDRDAQLKYESDESDRRPKEGSSRATDAGVPSQGPAQAPGASPNAR